MATSHQVVWEQATVVESIPLTRSVRRIVLRPTTAVRVPAGAHVDVRLPLAGRLQERSYSVVDAAGDGSTYALSVLDSPSSRGGAAVMHGLAPGDVLAVTRPILDFPLRVGASRYLLLAGGIGITALASMAEVLRGIGAEYTLVYLGRSRQEMAYVAQLRARHGDRLHLHVRDEGTSVDVVDLVSAVAPGTELYLCGPIRLMDAVRRAWIERELPYPDLRFETFGNSGWFEPRDFVVRVPELDLQVTVGASETMLEALETAGADMMFDCRKGECGLCEVRVLDLQGDLDHRDVFYSERQRDARSKMCCCVSRAVGVGEHRALVTIQLS